MSKRKAQGLVEFALILPVLLLMILAIIDFGWVVFNYVQLNNAVREALRYGSVPGFETTEQYRDCQSIYNHVKGAAPYAKVTDSDITVYYDKGYSSSVSDTGNKVGICSLPGPYAGDLQNGQRVVVQINTSVKFLTPFFSSLWPQGIEVNLRGARTIFPTALGV